MRRFYGFVTEGYEFDHGYNMAEAAEAAQAPTSAAMGAEALGAAASTLTGAEALDDLASAPTGAASTPTSHPGLTGAAPTSCAPAPSSTAAATALTTERRRQWDAQQVRAAREDIRRNGRRSGYKSGPALVKAPPAKPVMPKK